MKKKVYPVRTAILSSVCAVLLSGCAGADISAPASASPRSTEGPGEEQEQSPHPVPETETPSQSEGALQDMEVDWSGYFDGRNGAAVVYDPSARKLMSYNSDLASVRRSPCSTFKIISSLIALENGILEPENSIRPWSGEIFRNEDWNRDISFEEAFRASCVWYFRQLTDEIGSGTMGRELERLSYGNCDISDWEGDTDNNNRALTGFWLESSLEISPREQVQVMERIFGKDTVYSEKTLEELKKVMLVPQDGWDGLSIYGKTGTGMTEGAVVDAWFTGFARDEREGKQLFFCVWLGRTDDAEVSGAVARKIAIDILSDPASVG